MHIFTCNCYSASLKNLNPLDIHTETHQIHDWLHRCWDQAELKGRGSFSGTGRVDYGHLHAQNAEKTMIVSLEFDNQTQKADHSLIGYDGKEQQVSQCAWLMAKSVDALGPMANEQQVVPDNGMQSFEYDTRLAKSFVASLKACTKHKDLHKGSRLHTEILHTGLLERNEFIGSALVSMYAKCGALHKAQEVFHQLPFHTDVLWNTLITGWAQHGLGSKALNCYEQMQSEGFLPNAVTFTCILKACGSIGALHKGQQVHTQVKRKLMLETDVVLVSALVDMYAKCGAVERAQEVFDEFPVRDLVSWNALIAGYAQHGHGEEAFRCYEQMQLGGFSPNAVTFACILKGCGSIGALDRGQEIHAEIMRDKTLENCDMVFLGLIDMYAKCGALHKAQELFDQSPNRSVVAWNALISGYAQHGCGEEALQQYEKMKLGGFSPDAIVFASILNACGSVGAFEQGEKLHVQIVKEGLLETDLVVANALIDMYAKCNLLGKAQKVFNDLAVRNIVSWTTLIAGYAQHGYNGKSLDCYEQMLLERYSPDAVTFVYALKSCGSVGDLISGERIHSLIEQGSSLRNHVAVANAVVDMYAKCGALEKAQEVFEKLLTRDKVSWTALIAGYAEHGLDEQAVKIFEQMQTNGFSPDAVTVSWVSKVCGNMGAAYRGQEVHTEIVRFGLMEDGVIQGTVLITMYANCGMLVEAQYLFDKLSSRDVVSWTALMAGYAQLGKDDIVFNLLDRMLGDAMEPNSATFTVILSTCCHRGLVEKGLIDQAIPAIEMGVCQTGVGVNRGLRAFHHALQLYEEDTSTYVSMSTIYGVSGKEDGL